MGGHLDLFLIRKNLEKLVEKQFFIVEFTRARAASKIKAGRG